MLLYFSNAIQHGCIHTKRLTLILTLKVTEFPDAVRQEGSPGPDEEIKKIIQIGRTVRELLNRIVGVTYLPTYKLTHTMT